MAIMLHDKEGRKVTDPKEISRLVAEGHHHCMSPYFGAWVAGGIGAFGLAVWKLWGGMG